MKKIVKKVAAKPVPKVMKKKCVYWEACPNKHTVKAHGNGEFSIDLHYCPNPMTESEHTLYLHKLWSNDPDDAFLLHPSDSKHYGWDAMMLDEQIRVFYVMERGELFIRGTGLAGDLHVGGEAPISPKKFFPPNTTIEISNTVDRELGALVKTVARGVNLVTTSMVRQVCDFYIFSTTPSSGDWGKIVKIAYRNVPASVGNAFVIHDTGYKPREYESYETYRGLIEELTHTTHRLENLDRNTVTMRIEANMTMPISISRDSFVTIQNP